MSLDIFLIYFKETEMTEQKCMPITPLEALDAFYEMLPNEVFHAFNELIGKNFSPYSKTSTVTQDEVIQKILEYINTPCNTEPVTKQMIFDRHWLDIEQAYETAGWDVDYKNMGSGSNPKKTFVFTQK